MVTTSPFSVCTLMKRGCDFPVIKKEKFMQHFNESHYPDPTAGAAMRTLEREMNAAFPIIYICSAYRNNTRVNIMRAREYCRFAVRRGCIPLAPHLLFPQFMSEEQDRALAIRMNFVLLRKCRELWAFGTEITEGMEAEIAKARSLCIPIRYFNTKCEEVVWG